MREAITAYNEKISFNSYHNPQYPQGEYIELNVSFIHHKQTIVDEELTETMELKVTGDNNDVVYSETITFDLDWFTALINSKNSQYRKPEQVELARRILNG